MEQETWTWTVTAELKAKNQEDMQALVEHLESELDQVSDDAGIEGAEINEWQVRAS